MNSSGQAITPDGARKFQVRLLADARLALQSRLSELEMAASVCGGKLTLFFSVCEGESRAVVLHFTGPDLSSLWSVAEPALLQTVCRTGKPWQWLRVDWINAVQQPVPLSRLKQDWKQVKRNYFRCGLAFDSDFRVAFTEQELNANACLYGGNEVPHVQLNEKNFQHYSNSRFGAELKLPFQDESAVWVFETAGLFLSDAGMHAIDTSPRNEGRRVLEDLNADTTRAVIDSASKYLASQVRDSGQFVYGHFPVFGHEIPTYNTLRHASSVYAMLEAWELNRDDELMNAIRRAIDYLLKECIRVHELPGVGKLAFNVEIGENEIKLGASAVAILAFVKYDQLTGDTQYRALLEQLALGIAAMQNQHTGQFVHVLHADTLKLKEAFRIVYYDGEAAFALMRLYGLTKDPRWLFLVKKAFDYFIEAKHWKHHDHWLSYCVNELTLYTQDSRYFKFGVQNIFSYLDFIEKRETTFPTLLELCMAFEQMLRRIQATPTLMHLLDGFDVEHFYRAMHTRANHLMNGFFFPEVAMYFKKPASVLGSFFIRHQAFRVRIDDVEHYLSGLIAYLKALESGVLSIDSIARTGDVGPEVPSPEPKVSGPVVAWAGDVNLGRRQHYRTRELGVENIIKVQALTEADLSIVNLECVVATKGQQGVEKGEGGPYYYRARPEMLRVLAHSKVGVVTTANNHSGDYGPDALLEQLEWLEAAGIGHVGTGRNLQEAFSPVFRRVGDVNLAIFSVDATQPRFAASETKAGGAFIGLNNPEDWFSMLKPRIEQARFRAHVVFVAVHWGENFVSEPTPNKIHVGRRIIDAGADAVLGASAHVLQGIEIYRNCPIIHDAGDFLFDSVRKDFAESGVFQMELSHNGVELLKFIPVGSGFGFTIHNHGEDAIAASQAYQRLCKKFDTKLLVADSGHGFIQLKPARKSTPFQVPAPKPLHVPCDFQSIVPYLESQYTVGEVPQTCKINPMSVGPLVLLGLNVSPKTLRKRQMLWVESYWSCKSRIDEDLRISWLAHPTTQTSMSNWGVGMDHDPCDWMLPTSNWTPGLIYRDFYGLRPVSQKAWDNVNLQLSIALIGPQSSFGPFTVDEIVKLDRPQSQSPDVVNSPSDLKQPYSFSSTELQMLTGGEWVSRPESEVYVDHIVSGAGLVEEPRTCMVCMDYETWLKGTGNSGHYKNIFSDSHVSFATRYKQLNLEGKVNCLIVQRPIPEMSHIPQLLVKDSYEILKTLASCARDKMGDNGTVFAVTGAVGKSTTCSLLALGLKTVSNCIAMTNGHNSRTGVTIKACSLGLFSPQFVSPDRLPNTCVLEVAGSALWMKTGWVMKAVRPDIAIITHIELTQYGPNSKTLDDVARFKSRICEQMHRKGLAVLYREMPLFEKVMGYVSDYGATPYTYGESLDCNSRLISYEYSLPTVDDTERELRMKVRASVLGEFVEYEIGAIGKPVALNSLAALTAGKLAGFKPALMAKQFAAFKARKNTLDVSVKKNILFIDCSHNLEIPSILAAFDVLDSSRFSASGRKIVIISRIVNLGEIAQEFHLKLEQPFNEYGFDRFFIHNPDHEWDQLLPKVSEHRIGGVSSNAAGTISQVLAYLKPGDAVLVLGASRGCDFGEVLPGIYAELNARAI